MRSRHRATTNAREWNLFITPLWGARKERHPNSGLGYCRSQAAASNLRLRMRRESVCTRSGPWNPT
eukprot:CAMPEP_0171185478 /NCGR_PEP_ID=MMETSP0790-20130122/16321_1 /TAXON_ID=2925 /ORGANISM="Alexandrium catenella, Strain OF101" /LENGTH=65 /DNA_ID=CAMNT_0011650499 /DNA_START=1 /DNA_END=198 /DNA_ORIENTATION=-